MFVPSGQNGMMAGLGAGFRKRYYYVSKTAKVLPWLLRYLMRKTLCSRIPGGGTTRVRSPPPCDPHSFRVVAWALLALAEEGSLPAIRLNASHRFGRPLPCVALLRVVAWVSLGIVGAARGTGFTSGPIMLVTYSAFCVEVDWVTNKQKSERTDQESMALAEAQRVTQRKAKQQKEYHDSGRRSEVGALYWKAKMGAKTEEAVEKGLEPPCTYRPRVPWDVRFVKLRLQDGA